MHDNNNYSNSYDLVIKQELTGVQVYLLIAFLGKEAYGLMCKKCCQHCKVYLVIQILTMLGKNLGHVIARERERERQRRFARHSNTYADKKIQTQQGYIPDDVRLT